MKGLKAIPYSYGAMAFLAIILGLVIGGFPSYSSEITLISLIVVMSLSTREVKFTKLRSIRSHVKDFIGVFLLNYIVLSITILAMAYYLFDDMAMIRGLAVFAVVPSAIAVIPFTNMLKGDTELSLISSAFLYISSLVIAPVVLYLLFGKDVGIWPILRNLLIMIVVPIIISRILLKVGYDGRKEDKVIVNLSFFLIIFGAIGANRHLFIERYEVLLPVMMVGAARALLLPSITYLVGKYKNSPSDKLKSYTLFSAYKNGGLAILLAVALFGAKASFPIVVGFPFDMVAIIFLKRVVFKV